MENSLKKIFIISSFFIVTFGYPEIGFLAKLESDVSRTSVGWQKIANWKTSLTDVKGLYNFDASLATSGDISIPVTGIFFISVSLPVSNADTGLFKAALIINDITTDKSISLSCRMENMTSGTQMLSFSGFISLRADETIAVYAYSSIDTAWSIKSQSSFTFHYFGRFGSTPGFLAHPMSSLMIQNPNATKINTWRTNGRGGLFQSLTGFTKSNGKFTTVCSGIYILTANIIFEGGPGDYSLTTLFNVESSIVGTTHMSRSGLTTVNVYQAFSLPKGTAVDIGITSNAGMVKVLEQSSWSMAYIGATSTNTREFASFLTSNVEITGGQWSELPGVLRDSATQAAMGSSSGQFIMPSNLFLVNTQNFAVTDQTELYYAFVHLVYSGNASSIESMVAVSADKTTATGKEGIYGSMTKVSEQQGTISLSGIFHIRKQEHLSIFIKTASSADKFTVHNTSFVSFVRMRYVVSSFSARIETKLTYQKSGWNEVKGPWLTETYGLYSYGKDFTSTTGRFTASHTGVYMIAANIQINKGNGATIALNLAKNGIVDPNNGMYAVNGEPSIRTTLNLYGTVSVKTGDQLSLFAYKSSALDWEIDVKSGFSITYVGPDWAVYGFHAVLANDQVVTSPGQFEIDGWTVNSANTAMTYKNNIGFSLKRYTSPIDGVYVVSANLYLRNISIPGAASGTGLFTLQAFVNGLQSTSIGLEDSKPSFAENSRDYYTISFSGAVRIKKGEYLSLFLTSTADASFTVSKESGFSVALVSIYAHSHNQGLLGSKNVFSYLANPNQWQGIVSLSTTTTLPGRFVAGTGLVTTPNIHYSVSEPGIYYVTGNVRLENAGGGSLFEIQSEIDSQSSQTYGMYAVESSPKGNIYNLNFGGSVYLTFGQQIRVMVKSSKSNFNIGPGSSFSIVKLQLDEHFPGVVVDKYDASFAANQLLSNWEESTKPGLLTSNVGYKAVAGTYTPPVSGIYIVSINNYLNSATDTTSISLIDSGSSNTIKAYGSNGDNRTMLAASAVYLDSNKTFSYQLNSTAPKSYLMEAGWSLYFIKTTDLIEGFSGRLSGDFMISSSNAWMTVSNWTNSSSNGFSSRSTATMVSYSAVYAGAHFITFSPVAMDSSSSFDLKISVTVNYSVAMMASLDSIPANKPTTLTVSGTLKLGVGDLVEFQVYASTSSAKLTSETSRSLVFIEGITTHTEGVAGQKSSNLVITGAKTDPKQISSFDTTKPGAFSARNGTLTDTGSLVNFHAGVFLYTANIIVLNSAPSARKFRLYSVINSEAESSFTLQSIQTIDANKQATLSLSSTIFLPRFSQVATLITTDDDVSFEIVQNSTFTFILIDDNTGPVICEDQGLNMERLVPSDVRISTDKSVTFTCTVVANLPANLNWYRNGQIIPGQTSNTYTLNPTQVSDSASYSCKASYQSLTAVTNNATLSVYDPTPKISASFYNVTLVENIPPGSLTLQSFTVSAEKYAINQPAIVSGHIVSGDPFGDFQLSSPSTNLITIKPTRALDYEKMSFYSLSITVVNTEEPDAKNTTIIFNITVTDRNDNPPVFTPNVIFTAVPEDLPVGSVVYKATANDPDSGVFGIVTYSMIGNLSRPYFDINSTTGEITLKKSLDRETEDKYVLIIQASDSTFSSVAEFVINVTDVNDNQPRFNPETYSLSVVENILVGSSIVQVFSSDPDLGLNASMNFAILSGNELGQFQIDSTTGVISLLTSLDHEAHQQFNLTIGLNDKGSPMLQSSKNATVAINVVDINDNFPVFTLSLYTASVPENENISASILQVQAADKDRTMKNSNITYSINQTLANEYFLIEPSTGVIRLKAALDYETYRRFDFSVIAIDSGDVAHVRHTEVIIMVTDVNNEAPYFKPTSYSISISEFAAPGALVMNLYAFDNDTKSSSLQYQFTSQSPKEDFLLPLTSGEMFLKNYLDRENISSYTLTVSVSDGVNMAGQLATVTVTVLDENDNNPMFLQSIYKASLSESANVGAYVTTVNASDRDIGSNAALMYSILPANSSGCSSFFTINSTTGVISLGKKIDFETTPKCSFIVVATDKGRVPLNGHATVEVTILDVNDNAPYFTAQNYTSSISEASDIGSIVAIVKAFDTDSTNLTYEIIDGNSRNHFRFMSSMPNVLILASELDYENMTSYTLTIRAFDGVFYSTNNASLIIRITDENDNNPVFNQTSYTVTIPENEATSSVILTVFATDRDGTMNNSKISYSALEVTSDFTLNAITGEITVKNIDYERQQQYSLVVVAKDHGMPSRMAYSLVTIVITDVNDNAPVFSPASYAVNISEATIVDTQIVVVKATDSDALVNGEIVYSIVAGNDASKFSIQSNTGIITLASMLDYEGATKWYNLTISATDKGGMTAAQNATVLVYIVDINDNQPMFDVSNYYATINEMTNNGSSLLTVHAADRDGTFINSNMFYHILPSMDSGNFSINSTSGVIYSAQLFDREAVDTYSFHVEARDTGNAMLKGRCMVTIRMSDYNDNNPIPDMLAYNLNISVKTNIGSHIVTILATDKDIGINAQLTYSITSGNTDNTFTIDNKGVIRLAKILDTTMYSNFMLTVKVQDQGSPSLNANVSVNINIVDIPTSMITFEQTHYIVTVNESYVHHIGQIKAKDTGNITSQYIIYEMLANNINDIYLHSSSGDIYLNTTTNYERRSRYDFTARARNNLGVSAFTHVTIIILDVNEMPYFMHTVNGRYTFNVSESVHPYTFIGSVYANDNDTGMNGQLTFSLVLSGASLNTFSISQHGRIYNKVALDYESVKQYTFQVKVEDQGNPRLSAMVWVTVDVTDYNDNHPVFVAPTPSVLSVAENATTGTEIGRLNATDRDSTSNGEVIFKAVYPSGILKVNETTGVLMIDNTTLFDYEKVQYYDLVVIAEDKGTPHLKTTHKIRLNIENVNDNSPYFDPRLNNINFMISEDTLEGALIISLKADDNDLGQPGTIASYSIISGDPTNTFAINSNTGIITLNSKLSYKKKSYYSFTVQATDAGMPARTGIINININVTAFTMNPMFTMNTYYVSVYENIATLTNILQVNATSKEAKSGPLVYSIIPNNYSMKFEINNTTGIIKNTQSFDFEKQRFYTFVIQVHDTFNNRMGQAHVVVNILDVNDNSPQFVNTSLSHDISEATPVGTVVLTVRAQDADSTTNGQILFKAASGDGMNKFTVEPDGRVLLSSSLDSKINQNFTLVITAYDLGNPSRQTNITVTFNVIPANIMHLSLPVFNQSVYNAWVNEGMLIASFLQVHATNQAVASQITYTIQGTASETAPFSINSTSGELSVITALNYEMKKMYKFRVIATNSHGRTATAYVNVYVRDTNDNRPVFSPKVYTAYISEFAKPSDFVTQLFINDNDTVISNGPHNYVINSGNNPVLFNVSNKGLVYVENSIDYESLASSTITLKISVAEASFSSISEATVNVIVRDENDNPPRFNQSVIYLNVTENTLMGTILYNFTATDNDGTNMNNQVTYSLLTEGTNFAINNMGHFSIRNSLDYEKKTMYELVVKATDNGSPTLSGTVIVIVNVIDVNDNPPVFPNQCSNTVSEGSPVGLVILSCPATDKDSNSNLVYSFNNTDVFTVDNTGTIKLAKPLDSTVRSSYNLTLVVSDGVHSTSKIVTITVVPASVCRPMFNQSLYIAYIREDSHIQTSVLTVAANDSRNSTLVYSIEAGVTTFEIGADGLIKTRKLLDYNVKNMYVFKVFASGGTYVAESVVIIYIIDINNKLPLPGQLAYNVQISEKAAIGAIVIGINASDADTNTKFTYSIDSGNILDSFRVDTNGRILVNKPLDYELLPSYMLKVSVSDGVHTSSVPVNIQVLDVAEPTTCGPCLQCPPVSKFDFMKAAYRTISISESTMPGTVLTTVQLNQASQNNLIAANYSIEDSTANMYFSVNNTGHVTLKKVLDAMTLRSMRKFSFPVYNQFQCRKAATEIIIDNAFTSCPPQFKMNYYKVDLYENHPLHQVFLTVQTMLFSSSAIYSIEENSARTIFSINQTTGGISLISGLDYETTKHHLFTVKVNITNQVSYVGVTVNVKDVNDNCPQLSAVNEVLYQPVQVGAICGYIQMNDSDSFNNHTFSITSGDVNNNFTIDNNGVIRARTVITSQTKTIYGLVVNVDDGVCSKTASISIVINKDIPPACPTPPSCYNYTCAPCATTQPLTKCPDKFCPGCPVCPTTSAPCPTTQMTTACPVKTCPACPSNCSASVTCPACPTLQCPSCLAYTKYIFKQAYYEVSVYENKTVPSDLLTVHINGALSATYSIVETNVTNMFHIDPSSGKITLKSALDYTTKKSHRFTVRATVGGEYSDAVVVVNVLDVNNNCPVFSQSQTYTRLTSPVESGTIIAWNKATDLDTTPSLTYQIVAGDSAGEFTVDNMGVIKTQKRVVIAGSKTFNLTVRASDGVCSADSYAVVIIHLDTMFTVTPSKCPVFCPVCPICTSAPATSSPCPNVTTVVNQTTCPTCPSQCPACVKPSGYMFAQSHYWVTLDENTTYSNAILTVNLAGSVAANFSIVEASALTYFKINRTTGAIWLLDKLDYEMMTKHNFTVKASFADQIESFVFITVYVRNINDNNPYFITSSYSVSMHEYSAVGALVVQLRATDADDKNSVRMSIASGNTNSLFNINSDTGVISLAKQPYLYSQNTYNLQISLADTGNRISSTNAMITVHINRLTSAQASCSIYGSYAYLTKTLAENTPSGTVVASAAQMPNSAYRNIMYSISNPEALAFFQINSTTGEVTTKALLNYEKQTSHNIVVNAFDPVTNLTSVSFILVNVTNINEFAMTFGAAPTTATVSELASISTYVVEVRATDADGNAVIRHSITSGNNDGTFTIDPITGIIRLNKTLNHQTGSSYPLTICATDQQTLAIVCHNLTVNVKNENNNNIQFGQTSYTSSLQSNATVGAIVTTISASDPDNLGPLTFSLSGTTTNEYFEVDSSGVVKVKKSLSGSGLSSPYVIMVCATDSGSPSTTQCVPVIVSIGGTSVVIVPNNYDPYFLHSSFNAVVNENATIGTTVMKLVAADNDTGVAGLVHYNAFVGTNSDYFNVDELTGVVTILKALNTTNAPKAFFFTLNVRDHGSPIRYSAKSVNISIGVLHPVWTNNSVLSVSSLTMDVILSKLPFVDSKVLKYEIVAQEYDPNIANFNELSAMSPVSWYFVNFIADTYHHRRFVIATIAHPTHSTSARRKRREVLENNQATHLKYRVGNEQGCELKTLETSICNGPLMPGKSYRYQLVGYYADNNPVTGAFTAPSATSVSSISAATGVLNSAYIATYWIIGLVVLSLMFFIAVLAIVVLLCYKKRYRVYTMGAKTFANPMYAEQPLKKDLDERDNVNFYASDTVDGYSTVDTLKNKESSIHHVDPEEFEMVDHQPIGTLGAHHSFQNYETVSDQVTFEEENPEWVSMDISLKVDPSGQTDPVIMTREKSSDSSSSKKASVSSDSSHEERKQQQYAPPDYDDVPAEPVNIQGVRISVVQDDDDADQGITKL